MIRIPIAMSAALAAVLALGLPGGANGEAFPLPPEYSELIGEIQHTKARQEDTLIDIAREFSLGQDEIVMANPKVDRWYPREGTEVLVPRRFILPDAPRVGIVLNIPEMRLYYYPGAYQAVAPKAPKGKSGAKGKGKNAKPAPLPEPTLVIKSPPSEVITYPVSIGRMDWRTPLGATRVIQKVKDPVWIPPESIKREHAQDGDILPDVVPAGPNNPLGKFAMKLGVPGYLIHGTGVDKAYGIGMRVTHGCIRMYPEDIEQLFPKVNVGMPVRLVNQPVKLGWDGEDLYAEVHQPLDEDRMSYDEMLNLTLGLIEQKTAERPIVLNGAALKKALEAPTGMPVLISKRLGA